MKIVIKTIVDFIVIACLSLAAFTLYVLIQDCFSQTHTWNTFEEVRRVFYVIMGLLIIALTCAGIRSLYNEKDQ